MERRSWKINRRKVVSRNRSRLVVVSLLLAIALVAAPLFAFAEGPDASPSVGTSTTVLGDSTMHSIYSAEDLLAAVSLGASADYSGIVLNIENDFSIAGIAYWQPIGTEGAPFNGVVEGNGYTIYGVGSSTHPTLFGYMRDATVKNLNIATVNPISDPNPYYGLLKSAENCTIVNCKVFPLSATAEMNRIMLFSGTITADPDWITDTTSGGAHPTNPIVQNERQLWAFAEAVNAGTTFMGKTVKIDSDIDGQGQVFIGIGTEGKPFKGCIDGNNKVISNLRLENKSASGSGLVGYAVAPTASATISIKDLRLQGIVVSGTESTGALLGYGKDVVVTNCSVDGTVTGSTDVGALIGKLELTVPFIKNDGGTPAMANPYVEDCYSTANVNGSLNVGGLVGGMYAIGLPGHMTQGNPDVIIKNCITTGSVTGTSQVGGVVGYAYGEHALEPFSMAVGNSASISVVSGVTNVGGILGAAKGEWNQWSQGAPYVVDSYFAGTVKGLNYVGGLIGSQGGAKDSYVSGHVVSPQAFSDKTFPSIWPAMGADIALRQSGVMVMPNTVHRPGDPTNVNPATIAMADGTVPGGYLHSGSWSSTVDGDINEPLYRDNVIPDAYSYSYFGSPPHSMVASAFSTNATSGHYPELSTIKSGNPFYQAFSTLSTDPSFTSFPDMLYVNGSNEASTASGGAAFTVPSGLGLTWKVNGKTSVDIEDKTLPGGVNTISITGNKITATAKFSQAVDVVLSGETSTGISLKYTVTFMDEAARPIFHEIAAQFVTDPAKLAAAPDLLVDANMISLTFPEGVLSTGTIPSGGVPVTLTEYPNPNLTGTPITHTAGVKITRLSDGILKVTLSTKMIPTDKHLKPSRSYELDLGSGSIQFKDASGNTMNTKFYFRTVTNTAPVVSFDTAFDLYAKDEYGINSTNATKDQQVVGMTEGDETYGEYWDGIAIEKPNDPNNGADINLEDNDSLFSVAVNSSLQGTNGYPAITNAKNQFMVIPGEYVFTYQVADATSLLSNTITRTYRVYSQPNFTRGGTPYTTLTATLNSTDMVEVYQDMQTNGITVSQAVEKRLVKKYLSDATSPDYLAAYRFAYDGSRQDIPVSFDTSGLTDAIFQSGTKRAMTLRAGNFEATYLLDINGTMPDYIIEVAENTYTTTNSFSRADARKAFNASVRQISTNRTVPKQVSYDFSEVDLSKYDIPQTVTITMPQPEELLMINGVDMTVSKEVSVIIVKEIPYTHPEDKEDVAAIFWETKSGFVKNAAQERVLSYELSYEEAARTPADFFRIVENRGGEAVHMTLPSGIKFTFLSENMNKALIPYDRIKYNFAIEPMYDMYILRDMQGEPVQQFFAPEEFTIPGTLVVTIPLNDNMPLEDLKLYRIDESTNKYVLVEDIADGQVKESSVVLEMTKLQGRYIITAEDMHGKTVGS